MVAILVVLTITVCLLVDWSLQLVQAKRARSRAMLAGAGNGKNGTTNPFSPPEGLFFSPGHSWAHLEPTGEVKIGLDGLISFLLGNIEQVELPAPGQDVKEGDRLVYLRTGNRELHVHSPVAGRVTQVNRELVPDGHFIQCEPYGAGWICEIQPQSLSKDLQGLMVGEDLTEWHRHEAKRIMRFLAQTDTGMTAAAETKPKDAFMLQGYMEGADSRQWQQFQAEFLEPENKGGRAN